MLIEEIIEDLRAYDGPPLKFMEVCGTHTAAIFKSGIRSLISPKIRLISGPGCPVCVTPGAYIDRCIEAAKTPGQILLSFGDMMKVPGEKGSLSQAKGEGAKVELMYSPLEAVEKAEKDPNTIYVIAAVGFETTVPAYALALEEAEKRGITNLKLITAIKTVMPALRWICENETGIDGFICPGHVSVIIGTKPYEELAGNYNTPCAVAGFEAEHILAAIYDLVRQTEKKASGMPAAVHNLYANAVHPGGNEKAKTRIEQYFTTGSAVWRGLGAIKDSGLYLRNPYLSFDGGSRGLDKDVTLPVGCRCGEVIVGRIDPSDCPMFAGGCDPTHPYGPCMVSAEGACGIWFRNRAAVEK